MNLSLGVLYVEQLKNMYDLRFSWSDYEEYLLLGYKNPVRTSQESHYISATEPSRLIVCKISGIHGVTMKNAVSRNIKTYFIPHRIKLRLRYIAQPVNTM
jgi:hypothetical protein